MICEKCLHREVCDQSSRQIWSRVMKEEECSDFIDESKYVEVVHGEWIEGKSLEKCSICGKKGFPDWRYCPNCGAKMDGGKE